ncbi:hypothetical protein DOTSEDRAFT_181196 [Dothistroma septosporum NZE10]|uniref:Pyridoxamine 5'-phosphate oxidase N-terminal domain-containing protein n=1 Tax=Dothistroma septosporum (strain NZE10 / CBS 128990) TaxID=675120 RepID=M2YJH4_DOTSN|nr:hypothetical protein DOTSEDRAFT_181196 [Dothistroma septosporum NZE10]
MSAPPLRWETSAQPCNTTVSDRLPKEVATCLENCRYLHLATCSQNTPHVSLMNYTYLPSHPFPQSTLLPAGPAIIMTSNPSSKKTTNLISNPKVSLLVHDWTSSRPSTTNRDASPVAGPRSSLAAMLMQMNSTEMSSISATINGDAAVLEGGSVEERWCKRMHLENNTFDANAQPQDSSRLFGTSPEERRQDGGRESYIEDEDVRVVVVRIRDGRISDWKGGVKDWVIEPQGEREDLVNGVVAPNGGASLMQ